ncbi:MAG: hypothetical protein PHC34_03880 [Candidatus Gastranaerophilales bacterium]|nr:hypothetical protein [Candidatus Gastranaerophilales bacterium]
MNFLRQFCKFIQAILLFILPLILFYWFLIVMNLAVLKPFVAILGYVLDPFIATVRTFIHYELAYNGVKVDFTPLLSGGVILVFYFVFSMFDNLFNTVDKTFKKTQEMIKDTEIKKQQEQIRKNYLEVLAQNKIIYLVLKLRTNETSSAYLFNKEDDIFSEGITNTVLTNIIEASEKYESKRYKDFKGKDNTYNFIFYSITDAIDYSFYIYNKVIEANKNVIDPSTRVCFTIACNCSYSEDSADNEFEIAGKMLNLGGDSEIIASELFKEKYKALKEETNLRFESKGIYEVDNKQLEIFQIKVSTYKTNK